MKSHVDFLGTLFIVWGLLTVVVGLSTLALGVGAVALITSARRGDGGQMAAGITAAAFATLASSPSSGAPSTSPSACR